MKVKQEGVVSHYRKDKQLGFLRVGPTADDPVIYNVFFHQSRVTRCDVPLDEIKPGMYARVVVSDEPPKKPTYAAYALSVELFRTKPATATDILNAAMQKEGVKESV